MTTAMPPYSNPPALAGADACLWDINAKAANLPLYKYLGAHRHEIRAYASTVAYPTIDGYIDTLRAAVAEGFTAAKVHPFGEAARDIDLAKALREAFPHIDLMIDPVCAYTVPDALAVGRVLDELNFYWFENPISDQDLDGLAFLASKLATPLSVGEQNFAGFAAIHGVFEQAERVLRPHPGRVRGRNHPNDEVGTRLRSVRPQLRDPQLRASAQSRDVSERGTGYPQLRLRRNHGAAELVGHRDGGPSNDRRKRLHRRPAEARPRLRDRPRQGGRPYPAALLTASEVNIR